MCVCFKCFMLTLMKTGRSICLSSSFIVSMVKQTDSTQQVTSTFNKSQVNIVYIYVFVCMVIIRQWHVQVYDRMHFVCRLVDLFVWSTISNNLSIYLVGWMVGWLPGWFVFESVLDRQVRWLDLFWNFSFRFWIFKWNFHPNMASEIHLKFTGLDKHTPNSKW